MVRKDLETKIDKLDAKIEASNNLIRKDMESSFKLHNWMIGATLAGVMAILIRSFF